MTKRKPILCVDFDGVIHSYSKGWEGPLIIEDRPVDGSLEFILEAEKYFNVVILTSRAFDEDSTAAIKEWLKKYKFPNLKVTNIKPPAFLTIDDRTIRFTGTFGSPKKLLDFTPWNRK